MMLTLKSMDEIHASRAQLRARSIDFMDRKKLGLWPLPYHIRYRMPLPNADLIKSWDVARATELIEQYISDNSTPLLDMGCFNSEIVYALHKLGYKQVHGCDLNPCCRWMPFWTSIKYRLADLTNTPYADKSFGALTCMSVIEHGVPLEPLANEVTRLIKPGGLFIFTTDYDATGAPHEIDPKFRVFGQSWTIFTPETLAKLVDLFLSRGFTYLNPTHLDGSHTQTPIHWNEQDYTFVMVALKGPG